MLQEALMGDITARIRTQQNKQAPKADDECEPRKPCKEIKL